MAGRIGGHGPDCITAGADSRRALERLVAGIVSRHPAAGTGYAALRAWNMLVWQPVVLALFGVHRLGLLPSLVTMSQCVTPVGIWGYRLTPSAPLRGREAVLVAAAGKEIGAVSAALYPELDAVIDVKSTLARRLLADRIVSVVLRLFATGWLEGDVKATVQRWLAACGLEGQSGVRQDVHADGTQGWVPARRACCLEYLLPGASLCQGCPRSAATAEASHV